MIRNIIELRQLVAEEGMTLTNGKIYSKKVYLGCNDSEENWWEITDEEAARLTEQQEEEEE